MPKEIKIPIVGTTLGQPFVATVIGILVRAYIEYSGIKSNIWGYGQSMFPSTSPQGSFQSNLGNAIGKDDALLYVVGFILLAVGHKMHESMIFYFAVGFLAVQFMSDLAPFLTPQPVVP